MLMKFDLFYKPYKLYTPFNKKKDVHDYCNHSGNRKNQFTGRYDT